MTDTEQLIQNLMAHLDLQIQSFNNVEALMSQRGHGQIPSELVQEYHNKYCFHSDQALKITRKMERMLLSDGK